MAPANMVPSVCRVTGTGMAGNGIGGIRLSTTISAANKAINTVSWVFIEGSWGNRRKKARLAARVDCLGHLLGPLQRTHDQRHDQCQRMPGQAARRLRSEEHTSELQSLMRISYAV